jgi:hypothetical protein
MQAPLVKEPFDSPDWIFETKLDGFRAIAGIDAAGNARVWSRNHWALEHKVSFSACVSASRYVRSLAEEEDSDRFY